MKRTTMSFGSSSIEIEQRHHDMNTVTVRIDLTAAVDAQSHSNERTIEEQFDKDLRDLHDRVMTELKRMRGVKT